MFFWKSRLFQTEEDNVQYHLKRDTNIHFKDQREHLDYSKKWKGGKEINDKKLLFLRQDEKVDLEICMQIREACRRSKALIMEDYNYTSADKAEKKRVPREGGSVREN